MGDVAGGLLDHVDMDPAQRDLPHAGMGGGVVQGVGCGGGTGSVAGLLVVGKPMCG